MIRRLRRLGQCGTERETGDAHAERGGGAEGQAVHCTSPFAVPLRRLVSSSMISRYRPSFSRHFSSINLRSAAARRRIEALRHQDDEARLPLKDVHAAAERGEHKLTPDDADRLSASIQVSSRPPGGQDTSPRLAV
mgnify:CR=1 FL=1